MRKGGPVLGMMILLPSTRFHFLELYALNESISSVEGFKRLLWACPLVNQCCLAFPIKCTNIVLTPRIMGPLSRSMQNMIPEKRSKTKGSSSLGSRTLPRKRAG